MSLNHSVPDRLHSDANPTGAKNSRAREARTEPAAAPGDAVVAGTSLTRVTANFTPRTMAALDDIIARTQDSKTDALNRAVMVYQVFVELLEEHGTPWRVQFPDDTEEVLRFLG